MRNAYGNVTAPRKGYIWDACRRAGVSVRSYGEFAVAHTEAELDSGRQPPYAARCPASRASCAPITRPTTCDPERARSPSGSTSSSGSRQSGQLPRLSIIRLGNDHTVGTNPKSDAALHDRRERPRARPRRRGDLAQPRVEGVGDLRPRRRRADRAGPRGHAPFGRARCGPHRATGFGRFDALTTCGVLRTIELLLALPPMSQLDAARRRCTGVPVRRRCAPVHGPDARVPTSEKNATSAWGAAKSAGMDSQRGPARPSRPSTKFSGSRSRAPPRSMPPPVRAAFVRPVQPVEEEDDD